MPPIRDISNYAVIVCQEKFGNAKAHFPNGKYAYSWWTHIVMRLVEIETTNKIEAAKKET